MEGNTNYVKRTQKDYTLTLKLQVVKEVETGQLSPCRSTQVWHSIQF